MRLGRETNPKAGPWIVMTFRGLGDIKDQARETERNWPVKQEEAFIVLTPKNVTFGSSKNYLILDEYQFSINFQF